jgi:hypothetical protein
VNPSVDCDKLIKNLEKGELEAYVEVNKNIENMTSYGGRNELIECNKPVMVYWSNSTANWNVGHPDSYWTKGKKKGDEVHLDANQMIVCYPYRTMKKIAPCLKQLPLYYCSTEAKKRGEVDSLDATLCWAIKQYERLKKEEWREENR